MTSPGPIPAAAVHETLRRHLLVDGFDMVLDTRASQGSWLVDARTGARHLDLFSFFASAPLGMNHPALTGDPAFLAELTEVAVNKPSNSDIATVAQAAFVETFARVLGDPALPHLFLVEGGALAVENALKTAFDWKQQHNESHGRPAHLGTKVLHLRKAFHGRSGYTMSLTNTDPTKTKRFPAFDWPRIDVPALRFPIDDAALAEAVAAEATALEQARAAFAANPHDIACFIAEPIQGEGGDNHLRAEFLLAMQQLCREHDALFVLDEVQTGCGMTGSAWAYQQLGLEPDVVAFGKKLQVCGIMAGRRVDEVAGNVFEVPSRINSTWGGNLTDMVRSRRYLEVIESEGLVERAAVLGKRLLDDLRAVPGIDNVRGRGLFVAFDLPTADERGAVVARMHRAKVMVLPGGERSIRLRPALTIGEDELELAVAAITAAVAGTEFVLPGATAPASRATSVNPARTDEVVGDAELTDVAGFVAACRTAKRAQRQWAAVPAPVRGRVVEQIGRLVEANKDALARLVTREIGKPLAESLGEVQEVIDTASFFAGEGRRLYGQTVPSEMSDKQLFTFRTPVGVAAIVTAGNFPVAVPSWYLIPALLCGNTVVWKPAEYTPAIAAAFSELFQRGGLPDGVLQTVLADGPTTFEGLSAALDAGLVDKIGFTGSSAVGTRIGELAGRHLQVPCLELGGKNPLVVMPDADLDLAVEGSLFSGFGTAGQRCTSLGTVVVHRSVHDEFLRRFDAAVRGAAIGDPMTDVLYGPMISARFLESFERHLGLIRPHHTLHGSTGTGRITAANPREGFRGDPAAGLFAHPTIVDGVRADDEIYRTETFGPMVGVATFDTFDEAVELADGHGYGLSASIYTSTPAHAFRFRERIRAGMVSVNNSTSGAEAHLPFGGNGRSGNGSRQSGIWVLDQFTRWQSMNWDYAGTLQKAQMDTAVLPADHDFRL